MIDKGETLTPERDAAPDRRDQQIAELEADVEQAKAENARLKARIAQFKQRIAQLEQRVIELERAGKRQATPFAHDEHKVDPKRPGRKAGQGLFSYRTKPTPEEVDETKAARLDRCPQCGGAVTDVKEHEQFVIDLPEYVFNSAPNTVRMYRPRCTLN